MVQISKSNQLLYHNLTIAHTGSRHGDMRIPGKLYSSASLCLAFLLVYIYDSPFTTTWVPRNELLKIVPYFQCLIRLEGTNNRSKARKKMKWSIFLPAPCELHCSIKATPLKFTSLNCRPYSSLGFRISSLPGIFRPKSGSGLPVLLALGDSSLADFL